VRMVHMPDARGSRSSCRSRRGRLDGIPSARRYRSQDFSRRCPCLQGCARCWPCSLHTLLSKRGRVGEGGGRRGSFKHPCRAV
jgi:hypothetical protein